MVPVTMPMVAVTVPMMPMAVPMMPMSMMVVMSPPVQTVIEKGVVDMDQGRSFGGPLCERRCEPRRRGS